MPEENVYAGSIAHQHLRLGMPRVGRNSLLRRLLSAVDIPLLLVTGTLLTIGPDDGL